MGRDWNGVGALAACVLLAIGIFPAFALAATGPETQIPPPSPVLERRGVIVLKVAGYESGRERTLSAVDAAGGWMRGEQTDVNPRGRKHGWLLFTIPAGQEGPLFSALQRIGKTYVAQITTRDHTSEYEELGRRAVQLQAHEARLNHLLDSPRLRGSDILFIQERTFRAGVDQELLLQRRADLDRLGRTTAIQVELFEPGSLPVRVVHHFDAGRSFRNGLRNARGKLNGLLVRGLSGGASAVVYAPIWLPALLALILVGYWLGRWLRRAIVWFGPKAAAPMVRSIGRGVTLMRGLTVGRGSHGPSAPLSGGVHAAGGTAPGESGSPNLPGDRREGEMEAP